MSGKGVDDNHQSVYEIAKLALGWTKSITYMVTMHLLIIAVQVYLFWPLIPNYPHVWGDNVIAMLLCQLWFGVLGLGYPAANVPFPVLLGRISHLFGNVAIVMLLVHTVSHEMVVWIAIPSCLWFGSVLLFTLVDFCCILSSLEGSKPLGLYPFC